MSRGITRRDLVRDCSPFDISRAVLTERYDLAVVGAGISGLAAAHFYRQRCPNARVLMLDTNDDFGGHAKRNEVVVAIDQAHRAVLELTA
jgi:predicted NAD/FAD-binding protein